jgi:hypothetical protein
MPKKSMISKSGTILVRIQYPLCIDWSRTRSLGTKIKHEVLSWCISCSDMEQITLDAIGDDYVLPVNSREQAAAPSPMFIKA